MGERQGSEVQICSFCHRNHEEVDRLIQIDGSMPRLNETPTGCRYHPRCPRAFDRCRVERPELIPVGPSRVACWLYDNPAGVPAPHPAPTVAVGEVGEGHL